MLYVTKHLLLFVNLIVITNLSISSIIAMYILNCRIKAKMNKNDSLERTTREQFLSSRRVTAAAVN